MNLSKKAAKGDKEAIAAKAQMETELYNEIYTRMSRGANTPAPAGGAKGPVDTKNPLLGA